MKNGLVIALLVFVVLLFAVIGLRDADNKVGVREMKVEQVDRDKVTRIELSLRPKTPPSASAGDAADTAQPPARTRVILQKTGDAWTVANPDAPDAQAGKAYPADEALVNSALDALADLSVGDLVANKADKLAGYEIDDAQGQTVKIFAGDAVLLDVVFGRPAKSGGSTVRRAGSNDVHVAKGRLAAVTKKDLTGWRKKTLVDVKLEDIATLTTTLADGSVTVVEQVALPPPPPPKEGEPPNPAPKSEWKLVEPQALPAGFRLDPAQLGRAATSLVGARAVDFAEGVSDDVSGLGGSHTVVSVKTKDGAVHELHLGKEDSAKRTYARVGADPQLFLLSSQVVKQVARPLDDLRDLSLFAISADDVVQATFTGQTRLVMKQDRSSWTLVEPKTFPEGFEPTQMGTQVANLLRLRAARVDTNPPPDAFAKTGPTVELVLKDGKKQSLRFGAALPPAEGSQGQEPREYYARGGADELTYVVPAFTRNRYERSVELFRAPPATRPDLAQQIPGLEKLPPDVRKKLMESMAKGNFPSAGH